MTAVLHVVEEVGPAGQPVALHVIACAMRQRDGRALLLGGRAMGHAAVQAGMTGWRRRPPLRPLPVARHLPLRTALAAEQPLGEVHCWSHRLADAVGAMLRGTSTRVIRRRLDPTLPVDPAMLVRDRAAIRVRWGVGDDALVVALLSDHPEAGDAYEAAMAVGLCREALLARDRSATIHLLLHPMQRHAMAAHRLFANFEHPGVSRQDPRLSAPWQVVAGCDAALVLGDGAGLAAQWAVAAGVPVVAEQCPGTESLATHHPAATVRLARQGDLRTLSHLLTQTLGEPALVAAP